MMSLATISLAHAIALTGLTGPNRGPGCEPVATVSFANSDPCYPSGIIYGGNPPIIHGGWHATFEITGGGSNPFDEENTKDIDVLPKLSNEHGAKP